MMFGSKRILVALSLASYLLATTVIHALHDHSAAGCCQTEVWCGEFHKAHAGGSNSADSCIESSHHDRHSLPTHCEDSCFACRFLAAKSIVAAVVLPVERFETVCQLEFQPPASTPLADVECSLCRGPPSAC